MRAMKSSALNGDSFTPDGVPKGVVISDES